MVDNNGNGRTTSQWLMHLDAKLDTLHATLRTKLEEKATKKDLDELKEIQNSTSKNVYMLIGGVVLLEVIITLGIAVAAIVL